MHWLFFQTANLHCASNICSFVRIHILLYTSSLASLCVFFTYIRNVRVLYPSWFTGGSLRIPSSLLFSSLLIVDLGKIASLLSFPAYRWITRFLFFGKIVSLLSFPAYRWITRFLFFSSLHFISSPLNVDLVKIASWLSFPAYRWITRFLLFSSLPFISSPLNVDLHFPLAPPPVSDMASMHQIREGIFTGDPAYPFSAHIP